MSFHVRPGIAVCAAMVAVLSVCAQAHAQRLLIKPWDPNITPITKQFAELPAEWKVPGDLVYFETVTSKELVLINLYLYPDSENDITRLTADLEGLYLPQRTPDAVPSNLPADAAMIYLSTQDTPTVVRETFYHEWGHHIKTVELSLEDSLRWGIVWKKLSSTRLLPSEYSYASEEEGFAEAFSYWIRNAPGVDVDITTYFEGLRQRRKDRLAKAAVSPAVPLVMPSL